MQDLLLLHGALGDAASLRLLAEALDDRFRIHSADLPGHGSRSNEDCAFRMDHFASDVAALIREKGLVKPAVFGYSMGGYIAAVLEATRPGTFSRIATLATKWRWSPEIAAGEVRMLDAAVIEAKVPKFARALAARHGEDGWKTVLQQTAGMMRAMGDHPPLDAEALSRIATPLLLTLGDSDKMVSLEETLDMRAAVPNAQLAMLPATPHPIEAAPLELLVPMLDRFFG